MPPPVEPGTRKGPWKLDAAGEEGSGVGSGDATPGVELAGTMISGMGPVLPTRCPASEGVGSGDTTTGVELAGTMISGMGPVLPTRCPASEGVSGVGLG
jgi:hypothetical protein